MHKILLALTVVTNGVYIIWLAFHIVWPFGVLFFIAEFLIIVMALLFAINHVSQKHVRHASASPRGAVDIFITVVNEPMYLFEPVVRSAVNIAYGKKNVYLLDDGGREDVKELAVRYGVNYLSRPNKPQDFKAGNLNYALSCSHGDFILVLDADQEVIDRNILKELLGHFRGNNKLAVITTRQSFSVPPGDFNHDALFYEHIQNGKNEDNAALSTGSGVIYSRKALLAIGGFQTWNIVEDLYTSYTFHLAGFRTLYINKIYTRGTAPLDVPTIYKQRGTWALDTLRMFFRDCPLLKRRLSLQQKLHYTELGIVYIASAIAVPILCLLPILTLVFGVETITDQFWYALLRFPSMICLMYMYYYFSEKDFSSTQFWAALSPVYLKAFVLAFFPGKPKYRITRKVNTGQRAVSFVLPHLALFALAPASALWHIHTSGFDLTLFANTLFIGITVFWMYPMVMKGFTRY
jgi:cellulose synthase (UDP-forming)